MKSVKKHIGFLFLMFFLSGASWANDLEMGPELTKELSKQDSSNIIQAVLKLLKNDGLNDKFTIYYCDDKTLATFDIKHLKKIYSILKPNKIFKIIRHHQNTETQVIISLNQLRDELLVYFPPCKDFGPITIILELLDQSV